MLGFPPATASDSTRGTRARGRAAPVVPCALHSPPARVGHETEKKIGIGLARPKTLCHSDRSLAAVTHRGGELPRARPVDGTHTSAPSTRRPGERTDWVSGKKSLTASTTPLQSATPATDGPDSKEQRKRGLAGKLRTKPVFVLDRADARTLKTESELIVNVMRVKPCSHPKFASDSAYAGEARVENRIQWRNACFARGSSTVSTGEFDPGSERTLAAGLTHASRTRKSFGTGKVAHG